MGHDAPAAGGEAVVLFDGVCRFCSGSVRFILRRDVGGRFAFAPLQSPSARRLLQQHDRRPLDPMDSLVLVENGQYSTRSTAALRIVRHLSWPWPLLNVLILVPRPLRNFCYDVFARNRYRWFGKNQECFVPLADERERFLE